MLLDEATRISHNTIKARSHNGLVKAITNRPYESHHLRPALNQPHQYKTRRDYPSSQVADHHALSLSYYDKQFYGKLTICGLNVQLSKDI